MPQSGRQSFVTLATNDSYAMGALVMGHSLRRVGTTKELTILITDGVPHSFRNLLEKVFDNVKIVKPLQSGDEANLRLLKRPTLGITYTKLYCWKLVEFSKAVFLDADTLVLQNIDDLLEREEFSAAPDTGWPDIFNSGVFVFKPSLTTFTEIMNLAKTKPSFDGGDQGLLNAYFDTWSTGSLSKHLSYVDNCCCWVSANDRLVFYTRAPAWKKFGTNVRLAHFTGLVKPWTHRMAAEDTAILQALESLNLESPMSSSSGFTTAEQTGVLAFWWAIFFKYVKHLLSQGMFLATTFEPVPPPPPPFIPMEEQHSYYQFDGNQFQHNEPYHPEFHDTSFSTIMDGQRTDMKNQYVEYHHFIAHEPAEEKRVYQLSAGNKQHHHYPEQQHYHQHDQKHQEHQDNFNHYHHEQHENHYEEHHPYQNYNQSQEHHQNNIHIQSQNYYQEPFNTLPEYHKQEHLQVHHEEHHHHHHEEQHQFNFQEHHQQHHSSHREDHNQDQFQGHHPTYNYHQEISYQSNQELLDHNQHHKTEDNRHEDELAEIAEPVQETPEIHTPRDDKNPLFFALKPTCRECIREIKWSRNFVDPINTTLFPPHKSVTLPESEQRIRKRSLPLWSNKLYFVRQVEDRTTPVDSKSDDVHDKRMTNNHRNGRNRPPRKTSKSYLHKIQISTAHEQVQKKRTAKPKVSSNKDKLRGMSKSISEKPKEKHSTAVQLEDPSRMLKTSRPSTSIPVQRSRNSKKSLSKSMVTDSLKDPLYSAAKSFPQSLVSDAEIGPPPITPITIEPKTLLDSLEQPVSRKEVEFNSLTVEDSQRQKPAKLKTSQSEPQVTAIKDEYLCDRHRPQPPPPLSKMFAWERGEIDYCGTDRFSNILARIRSTIQRDDKSAIPIGIWL